MKNLSGNIVILCVFLTILFVTQTKAENNYLGSKKQINNSSRIIYTINDNWRFLNEDAGNGEKRGLIDNNWERINIPHTWNAADAFDDTPDYRRGAGWYRKELPINSDLKNKRIFLYFEGAN